MSGHLVLFQASRAIREALFNVISDVLKDSGIKIANDAVNAVSLAPPPEKGDPNSGVSLSLWLYFVSENEYVKNRAPRVDPDGTTRPPPLALTLYYLVTPMVTSTDDSTASENAEKLLGAVLLAFHQRPIIPLVSPSGENPEAREELHLSLCRLSVEELTRIWDALDRPYQLSVCFKVNVVRIESRPKPGSLVRSREFISGRLKENVG